MAGYFRGLSFPLASVAGVNAVFFGVYGSALGRLRLDVDDVGGSLARRARYVYAAGCTAGLAQTLVACPSDLIKVVLQSQLHHARRQTGNKKLSYRRGTARCVVSVEILPTATQ